MKLLEMPEGVEVELTDRQAAWIGLEPAAHPDCDGCVLFGLCALHAPRHAPREGSDDA